MGDPLGSVPEEALLVAPAAVLQSYTTFVNTGEEAALAATLLLNAEENFRNQWGPFGHGLSSAPTTAATFQ